MAAPTWATDLATFWLEGATTVTAIGTGGAGLGNPETDFFIQGTDCISKAGWTNAIKGFIIDALGTTFTVPTDGCVIGFAKYDAAGSLDTKAGGGLRFLVGSANNAYREYFVGGSDTLAFDSWVPYVVDPNTATADASAGTTSWRWVGVLGDLPTTSGPTKGNPIAMDAIRYGRGRIDYTLGDSGAGGANTFNGCEAYANATTRRWGLMALLRGSYLMQGFHQIGTSGTACYFRDQNKVFFWRASGANNLTGDSVSNAFNRIEIANASSDVVWDNLLFQALGTRARGRFYHTAGAFTATNCQFVSTGLMSLIAGTIMTDCTMRSTGVITAPGSDLRRTKVLTSRAGTDLSAVIWNVATDPDGLLDTMTFSKGTAAHHAITLGASTPATITLRGWTVTGFSAANGNNDSVILNTSGKSITVNVVGATGTISYKNTGGGSATTIVAGAVAATVTCKTTLGANIENARVFLRTSDGTGPFPYNASVTITNSGTTATVAHTAHGLATNDKININGASHWQNNGVFTITVTGVNGYTYTMPGAPGSNPTGTITATFVVLEGLTNASGQITMSRVFPSAQPVTGWARKSSAQPFFKTGLFSGSVSSSLGFGATVTMVSDE